MARTHIDETGADSGPVPAHIRKAIKTITAVATLGGLLFGYDTGVIAGALPFMSLSPQQGGLGLTPTTEGLVTSSLLLGAAFGAAAAGRLADRQGRKRNILTLAVIFVIGTVGSSLAPNVGVMVLFRVILGLAVGGASATVPIYIAEIAPVSRRGRLVTYNELMIVSGQMIAYIVNAVMAAAFGGASSWRWMLIVATLPAIALWIGMLFLPDTPRWYASMGRYGEALKVLRQVRPAGEAEPELERIEQNIEVERDLPKATWGDLAVPWIRHLVFVGVGIAICQQITGVNTIMYYAPTILQKAGLSTQNALTATIANGVISVLATFFGIWQVGRTGRRRMLITGQCGITVSLFLIGVVFFATPHGPGGQLVFGAAQSYLVLLFMLTFLCFQQGQISPVTWLMLSEIFPLRLRGFAVGLAVFIVWLVNFLIGFSFPILLNALGGAWTFAGFALVNVLMILFSTKFVPETKGMSLEELEDHFRHYEFTGSLPRGGRSGQ